GEFSGMAETAFLIENGEPTRSLRQTSIAFTLEELMKELDGIGKDVASVGSYLGGSIRLKARVSGPGSS
ncbi:MAG: metallopeptidase TldD-related protein, partial [Candidatus Korarchaeum sp.]